MFRCGLSVGLVLLGKGNGENVDKNHSNCNLCS